MVARDGLKIVPLGHETVQSISPDPESPKDPYKDSDDGRHCIFYWSSNNIGTS